MRPTYRLVAGAAVVGALVGLAAGRWPAVTDTTKQDRPAPDTSAQRVQGPQDDAQALPPSTPDQNEHEVGPKPTKVSRPQALQPLDRRILIQRSVETSPSGYLTITSIIQGVALGILAEKAIPRLSPLVIAQAIAVLASLVLVFHFYIISTTLLRWAPSILDALVPFIIGALEIPPAFYLGHTVRWSASVAVLWFVATLGLVSSRYGIPPNSFGNVPKAEGALIRLFWEMGIVTVSSTVLTLASSFLAWHDRPSQLRWAFVATAITLVTVTAIALMIERRLTEIYRYYEVERPVFV